MDLGLSGRAAIVTGSSKGIGKAIAQGLAEEGAKVAICARDANRLRIAEREIEASTGAEVLAVKADLNHVNDIKALVTETHQAFRRIDILVNNTGGPPSKSFLATSEEDWRHAFNQLFMSVVSACREVAPYMKKRRWGRIINMNSIAAKQPVENLGLSNSLRAGIMGLTKTLSNEFAEYNILVNSVCPGYTLTDRVEELARTESQSAGKTMKQIIEDWTKTIPLRRLAKPREIADLVVFLASERASFITGATYQVDGGWIKGTT
jgi:3-oxoacyl-[acyl-carrier protein] reductase